MVNSHTVMSIMSQKSWTKKTYEKKKETCVTSLEPIKSQGDTFQGCKFKCNAAGEEEGLLTHWSPAQGCLLWLQQLVGTRLAFSSARRTGSLQAPTSSSWGVSMRKSPRISSFPLVYSHSFTVCLQDHCWMQKGLKGDAALVLLVSSCLDFTALGFRTRAAGRPLAAWEPLSPGASKCIVHLCLSSSLQFESAAPELLRWQEKSKAVLFDLQLSPGLGGSVSLSAHLIRSTKEQ